MNAANLAKARELLSQYILNKQKATLGIYVHIPFCPHICPYCDFVKTARFQKRDTSIFMQEALIQLDEMLNSPTAQGHSTVTLYFGGGTPGIFSGKEFAPFIDKVQERFEIEECTIETNPLLTNQRLLHSWREAGIDRLTIGAQSLDPQVLQHLGRKHSAESITDTLRSAREAGFSNVQVDIIYGVEQTRQRRHLMSELEQVQSAGATGISTYALTIEPGTLFAEQKVQSNDDLAADEYDLIQRFSASCGWRQRETSNFSAYECKHNNIYWFGQPYLGIGTGAHGLLSPDETHPFGQRYSVGMNRETRRQRSAGDDFLDFTAARKELFRIAFEPVRRDLDWAQEILWTLLRLPDGIPMQFLDQLIAGRNGACAQLMTNPILLRAQNEGRIIVDPLQGIRLAGSEFLLGDAWYEKILRALGLMKS